MDISPAMSFSDRISSRFRAPKLSRMRILLALAVAIVADGVQLLLGPLGWAFADEIIDVTAMALETWLVGFHVLFLPTFVVEFIPVADMLPTWTGCVAIVVAVRKRQQSQARSQPPVLETDSAHRLQ